MFAAGERKAEFANGDSPICLLPYADDEGAPFLLVVVGETVVREGACVPVSLACDEVVEYVLRDADPAICSGECFVRTPPGLLVDGDMKEAL